MDTVKRWMGNFATWYVIGYLVVVVALGFLLARAQDDRNALRAEVRRARTFDDRRAFEICQAGNESRKAIVAAFRAYTDALVAASRADPSSTPRERQQRERQVRLFKELVDRKLAPLASRECQPPFGVKR